jgi:endoglucanase
MKKAAAALLVAAAFLFLMTWAWRCWDTHHWRQWQAFKRVFVQADGRVIDRTAKDRTTSEAQAYSLFFALVANDPEQFEHILRWTSDNLAQGDLHANLPAWLWGLRQDGSWGVQDDNPASDADLWMAYSLIEAGRLWQRLDYTTTGYAMLQLIRAQEVAEISGVGLMLIPAPKGFHSVDGSWRLNPSYLPEFQFRWLAQVDGTADWNDIFNNHVAMMKKLLVNGFVPDWYQVNAQGTPSADTADLARSSYDAIRVYLWAGMSLPPENGENLLLKLTQPYALLLKNIAQPPEMIDVRTGLASGGSPVGYSAAVLPFLAKLDEDTAVRQRQRLKNSRIGGNLGSPPHYYDQALAMLGEGWDTGRFRFGTKGQLIPRWTQSCCDHLH